jgi:hypothetical protein
VLTQIGERVMCKSLAPNARPHTRRDRQAALTLELDALIGIYGPHFAAVELKAWPREANAIDTKLPRLTW